MTVQPYPWRILVRNQALEIVGELDDYESLDMQLKFNDVSKWTLNVDRRNRLAANLLAPGGGIVVTRNGQTILSGDSDSDRTHQRDDKGNKLTINGSDDTAWLNTRQAHPQPGSAAPPYSTTKEHVVGPATASSVMTVYVVWNIGPGAPVVPRQRLAGYTDAGYGGPVTGRGRWTPLLALFQELATSGAVNGIPCGFRIVQKPAGLWFETYQPVNRSASVRFSLGIGNIKGFTYRHTPPEANYVFVGGQGEDTARTIFEQGDSESIAKWGRREAFVDASSAQNSTELGEAATKALTEMGEKSSLGITPIDLPTMTFGVHYGLGDRVSAVLDAVGPGGDTQLGDEINDVVRECQITLTPDSSTVKPAVGTDGSAAARSPLKFLRDIRDLKTRMNNQEKG